MDSLVSSFVPQTTEVPLDYREGLMDRGAHGSIRGNDLPAPEVKVWFGEFPILATVNSAHVISRKIEGVKKAWECRASSKLNELRYRDFSDPGNIICDVNEKCWVVDTELKSFDSPELDRSSSLVKNYLKKRFMVLSTEDHNSICHTFRISMSDIAMK